MTGSTSSIWKYCYWLDPELFDRLQHELADKNIAMVRAQRNPCEALGGEAGSLDAEGWRSVLGSAKATFTSACDSAWSSRRKDYEDPFRKMMYESDGEMVGVLGEIEDNSFLNDFQAQTRRYTEILDALAR